MSSSLSTQEADIAKDLLNIASLRGSQGSGVIVAQNHYVKGPIIRTLKTKAISGNLAYSQEFADLLQPRVSAIIGHARLPTKGNLEMDSVHPHKFAHITGVHNGTLWELDNKAIPDGKSDSALLFKSFAEKGVIETIKGVRGAYALVWVDEKEGTLNFLRNSQRPLHFKNVGWGREGKKNINTLYWSSEPEMLDFIFKRNYKGNNTWDTYLPVDTWMKFPLDTKHVIRPQEVVNDVRPLPLVTPTQHQQTGTRGNGGHGHRGANVGRYGRFHQDNLPWEDDFVHNHGGTRSNVLPLLTGPRRDPPSDVDLNKMTKQERKVHLKKIQKEEREAQQRIALFRAVNAEKIKREEEARKLHNIQDAVADLIDPDEDTAAMDDLYVNDPWDRPANDPNSGPPRHRKLTFGDGEFDTPVAIQGRRCAWCSDKAEVGQKVFLVGTDLGSKEFLCFECGTDNEYAADTIDHSVKAYVTY